MRFLLFLTTFVTLQSISAIKYKPSTTWRSASLYTKNTIKSWFVKRAEKYGIPWTKIVDYYQSNLDLGTLEKYKNQIENCDMEYPTYYTKPFHGYDEGNLNWLAAIEVEAATLSMSANYWKSIDPLYSEQWVRLNASSKLIQYVIESNNSIYNLRKVADIGCSLGISTEYLYNSLPTVSVLDGYDLSPYFLAVGLLRKSLLKNLPIYEKMNFFHKNVEFDAFNRDDYDLISAQFLFHEVPKSPRMSILNNVYNHMKPGGYFMILDLNQEDLKNRFRGSIFRKWAFEITEPHIFDYYRCDFEQELTQVGFEDVKIYKNDPLNNIIICRKPLDDKYSGEFYEDVSQIKSIHF